MDEERPPLDLLVPEGYPQSSEPNGATTQQIMDFIYDHSGPSDTSEKMLGKLFQLDRELRAALNIPSPPPSPSPEQKLKRPSAIHRGKINRAFPYIAAGIFISVFAATVATLYSLTKYENDRYASIGLTQRQLTQSVNDYLGADYDNVRLVSSADKNNDDALDFIVTADKGLKTDVLLGMSSVSGQNITYDWSKW